MTDRNVQYPNRYKLEKVAGTDNIVDLTPAPGEVTEEGTLINKATLLQDETVALYGQDGQAVPDDIFRNIFFRLNMIMNNMAMMTLTLKTAAGNPLVDIPITNLLDNDGNPVRTNSRGTATGYMNEGQVTLSISGYADIQDISKTYTIVKGETYSDSWTVTVRNFMKWTSSGNTKFSANVSRVDVSVGGGGGGAGGASVKSNLGAASGGSGGGGHCEILENVPFNIDTITSVIIGAGGEAGTVVTTGNKAGDGTVGGTSSILGVSALGGNPGSGANNYSTPGTAGIGNGNGAKGVYFVPGASTSSISGGSKGNSGTNGTEQIYDSFSGLANFGGGGGSGAASRTYSHTGGNGGSPGGGTGGDPGYNTPTNGKSGTNGLGGGGGSGGCGEDSDDGDWYAHAASSAKGGSGAVAVRMHLIAT